MSLNLSSIVENTARCFPRDTALVHEDLRIDYAELRRRVRAFAAHLRGLGIERGDRVALLCTNRPSFTIAYFGILHAGAIVVPISYLAPGREVAYALRDSGARALLALHTLEEAARSGYEEADACRHLLLFDETGGPLRLQHAPPVDPEGDIGPSRTGADDTAVILYTSGTTGEPKGAELTHFNMFSNAQFAAEKLLGSPGQPEVLGPGNVALAALPLFHSFGQTCNQNAALFGGAALSYLERFEPAAALEAMERDGVTLFAGVPTMYFHLLHHQEAGRRDLGSLRFCTSGGAAMPVEVMRAFEERYGVKILEGYGLSETSPIATFNVMWKERKPGSIGEPIWGCDVRVADQEGHPLPVGEVGELVVRGYNVMKGYWQRPEATADAFRSGWFHTGDMGRMDEDGYLWIVDRKKDLIIRGGFNVYPREVEEVLYAHPAVREAAVIGVPDPAHGEEVKAFVALEDGSTTPQEIQAWCRERLAASKYPRQVEVLPELPKGSTGKILRKELRPSG